MKYKLPRPRKREGSWWIPATPPHFDTHLGPYSNKADAESDRLGMEATINSPLWRFVLQDIEEEEEEFKQKWEKMKSEKEIGNENV